MFLLAVPCSAFLHSVGILQGIPLEFPVSLTPFVPPIGIPQWSHDTLWSGISQDTLPWVDHGMHDWEIPWISPGILGRIPSGNASWNGLLVLGIHGLFNAQFILPPWLHDPWVLSPAQFPNSSGGSCLGTSPERSRLGFFRLGSGAWLPPLSVFRGSDPRPVHSGTLEAGRWLSSSFDRTAPIQSARTLPVRFVKGLKWQHTMLPNSRESACRSPPRSVSPVPPNSSVAAQISVICSTEI